LQRVAGEFSAFCRLLMEEKGEGDLQIFRPAQQFPVRLRQMVKQSAKVKRGQLKMVVEFALAEVVDVVSRSRFHPAFEQRNQNLDQQVIGEHVLRASPPFGKRVDAQPPDRLV